MGSLPGRQLLKWVPLLKGICGGKDAASRELRWIYEYAQANSDHNTRWERIFQELATARQKGKPLQYILGNTYFGDMNLTCNENVLIPRWETAASVTHLAERFKSSPALPDPLRILDLCTGSGAIPLLFEHLFRYHKHSACLDLLGVDISLPAISLARHNAKKFASISTRFAAADILSEDLEVGKSLPALLKRLNRPQWDVLISNPPYIHPEVLRCQVSRSVRDYEPHLALVPSGKPVPDGLDPGDLFYPRLLEIGHSVGAKVLLFEVGDLKQAKRVATMAQENGLWSGVEIWKDEPSATDNEGVQVVDDYEGMKILGEGTGRSVLCWRKEGTEWLAPGS